MSLGHELLDLDGSGRARCRPLTVMFRQLLRTAKDISHCFCRNGRARGGLYVTCWSWSLFGRSEPISTEDFGWQKLRFRARI